MKTKVDKECVTHHFACDCREKMMSELDELWNEFSSTPPDRAGVPKRYEFMQRIEAIRKQLFGEEE